MDDLVQRLHSLSRHEHDDLSIGDEAAYEIERLTAEKSQMQSDFDRTCLDLQDYAGRMTAERDALARWKSTHAPRLDAIQGLLDKYQKDAADGFEAITSLQSEREANAILTAERDVLQALATCGCGDEFTNEHPGICFACSMPPVGAPCPPSP
jgi:hypothetical protein